MWCCGKDLFEICNSSTYYVMCGTSIGHITLKITHRIKFNNSNMLVASPIMIYIETFNGDFALLNTLLTII